MAEPPVQSIKRGRPGWSPSLPSQRTLIFDLLFLTALAAVLWLATSGLWDLRGPDEGRYVQISKELLSRSNWLQLTVFGEPYNQKPPLPFWFMALSMKAFGGAVTSWAVRLPAVLMGIATVLLTYLLGRRAAAAGDERRTGMAAALILMTMPIFMENVPQAELNVPFAFWITVTIWFWFKDRTKQTSSVLTIIGFWAALSAAFFTKGPLALLVVAAPMAGEAIAIRSWRPVQRIKPLIGLPIVALLIAAWFYAERLIYGAAFVSSQVGGETVGRLLQGDHAEPIWYYIPRLITALFPWSLLLPFAAVMVWRSRQMPSLSEAQRPFWIWALGPLVILCLAHGKRQAYLLPLLPPVAVLLGVWMVAKTQTMSAILERLNIAMKALAGILGLAGMVVVAMAWGAPSRFTNYGIVVPAYAPWVWLAVGIFLLLAAAGRANVVPSRFEFPMAFQSTVALLFIFGIVRFSTVEPMIDPMKTTRPLAARIDTLKVKEIAASDKGSKTEFHVYGHYGVKEVNRRDLTRKESLPSYFLIASEEVPRYASFIEAMDYELPEAIDVSRDRLMLYRRGPSLSGAVTETSVTMDGAIMPEKAPKL